MDSGNSGSISSSGDEEYDSRADTVPAFLNPSPTQFSSISHLPHSSLILSSHPQSHHPSLFDLSPSYLHALSQSQPNSSNPNSILNLDTGSSQPLRSEPNCTDPANLPGVSSSSQSAAAATATHPQALGHDDNARVSAQTNVVRSSKKRTRASRRAPTTVLTTDTTNFRAMVQEFTGIPAPPFSGSSYSRRLDLLTGSSSLRSTQLDTTGPSFYPLRPSPHKLHPNPLLLSSSPSTLLHNNNMVDAVASTTNTTDNSPLSIHFQLPPDLGLPYHNQSPPQNLLSMQNHPILAFQPPPPLHPFSNPVPGFGAKSQGNLSVPSLEDLGLSHGQVNAHLMSGASVGPSHGHVTNSETMPLRSDDDGYRDIGPSAEGRRDQYYGKVGGGSCKLNFSASSSSSSFNHEKTTTLENTSTRGEGAVDSWICSSD